MGRGVGEEVKRVGGVEHTVCDVHPRILHIIRNTDVFRRVERVGEFEFDVVIFDFVHSGCCLTSILSIRSLFSTSYSQNMPNWSINFAASYAEMSFCDITAHIKDSIDSVKMKRLKSVR